MKKEVRFFLKLNSIHDFKRILPLIGKHSLNDYDSWQRDIFCDNIRLRKGRYSQHDRKDEYYVITNATAGYVKKDKQPISKVKYLQLLGKCSKPDLIKEEFFFEFTPTININGKTIKLDQAMFNILNCKKSLTDDKKTFFTAEAETPEELIFYRTFLERYDILFTETTLSTKDFCIKQLT